MPTESEARGFSMEPFHVSHIRHTCKTPLWNYPWHAHDGEAEVTFLAEGKGFLTVNEKPIPMEAGEVSILPPQVYHFFSSDPVEPLTYYSIRFCPERAGGPLQRYFTARPPCIVQAREHLPYIKGAFETVLNLKQGGCTAMDDAFSAICAALLLLAGGIAVQGTRSIDTVSDYATHEILRYITDHREEKITLQSLAKRFSISPSHLSRIFYQAYHDSPINYLIRCRVTYATQYLSFTDMTIEEIAKAVGYQNASHFTNQFTSRIGCSPSEFRDRAKKAGKG